MPALLTAVKDTRPEAVLIENVPGLAIGHRRSYLGFVLDRLNELGYVPTWRIINAADYGVPQRRQRLFIIAMRGKLFRFPDPTHGPGRQFHMWHPVRSSTHLQDRRRCEQLIAHAEASLGRASTADEDPEWVRNYFDDAEYLAQVGTCCLDLKQADSAAEYLGRAVGQLPERKVRDRATYHIRGAAAGILRRDIDQALDLMQRAIPLVQDAPSRRNIQRLLSVRSSMPLDIVHPGVEALDRELSDLVA